MSWKFEAADFELTQYEGVVLGERIDPLRAAEIANAKLKEWLEAAPTVFSSRDWEPPLHSWHKMGMAQDVYLPNKDRLFCKSTHQAKLADIRGVEK